MKKKFAAGLIAGVLAATSAIGLSACGGVSIPKGDEVTKDKWAAAFEKTMELENYTLNASVSVDCKINGTVTEKNYSGIDSATGEVKYKTKEIKVEAKASVSSEMTMLYDFKGNKAYSENTTSYKANGSDDGEEGSRQSKQVSKAYYELSEEKDDKKSYWRARYSLGEAESSDPESEIERYEEDFWRATETSNFTSNYIYSIAKDLEFYETDDKENAEEKSIVELYDKFVYAGGVYTANLFREVDVAEGYDKSIYELVPCTVTVSFNSAECCVIGLGIKCKGEGNAFKKDSYNLDYTYEGVSAYAVTELKTTDVSKKANKDIVKAIEKAKQEKEENK